MTQLEKAEFHLKVIPQLAALYTTEFTALGSEPVAVDADNPTTAESTAIAAYQIKARVLKGYKTIVEQKKGAARLAMPVYEYVYNDVGDGTDAQIRTSLNQLYNESTS